MIDWMKMVTQEEREQAARIRWRETCQMEKLDFIFALLAAGLIEEESATSTAIPAEFAGVIEMMPPEAQSEARIRWAHLTMVPRMHPLILAIQSSLGWTDEQVDALFGWTT